MILCSAFVISHPVPGQVYRRRNQDPLAGSPEHTQSPRRTARSALIAGRMIDRLPRACQGGCRTTGCRITGHASPARAVAARPHGAAWKDMLGTAMARQCDFSEARVVPADAEPARGDTADCRVRTRAAMRA